MYFRTYRQDDVHNITSRHAKSCDNEEKENDAENDAHLKNLMVSRNVK